MKVGLRTALAHCCRFNERGLLHWPTDDWANDPDHRDDMFIHKLKDGTYRPCTLFGDMSPEALTVEGLRAMGESVKAKLFTSTAWSDNDKGAFDAGMTLIKGWAAIQPTAANTATADPPIGRLTWQGLSAYAAGSGASKAAIVLFVASVQKLFNLVRELFPRSRALDASAASSWILNAESIDTFFENCIFHSGAPIWLLQGGAIRSAASVTPMNGLADTPARDEFDAVIMATPGLSDDMKKSLKACVAKLLDTNVVTPEQNLEAAKDLIMGALSSPLQELNSGNAETAAKVVREVNTAYGEANESGYLNVLNMLIRLIYNLYRYRNDTALAALPAEDEKHFNVMYSMHRLLTKVTGSTITPIVTSLSVVATVFTPAAAAAPGVTPTPTLAQRIIAKPATDEIIAFVDSIYDVASRAATYVTFNTGGVIQQVTVSVGGKTYARTRFTSLLPIDPSVGIVAVHPAKPEFTDPVLRAANALNGAMPRDHVHAHPGGPAAMFGAFPPHHGGGGGGRGGGHGGGFGHHAQHEGRHPPPFASKHHEHYHDEDEHGGDERPAQRQRGGFFGAPAYIRQDGTQVDNWDEVAPRPTNAGPHYGYEGAPQQGRYASAYGRRVGPIDEYGRMLTDSQEQERLGRRHREMAAEHSLDGDMSDNFAERYDYVLADSDPITRAAKLAFLASPIYRGLLENLLEKDIVFPFGFLLYRPFITHNMATAILTKKGAETGETLIGHADFQLGDDVARKMHYGHYTMYLKSIVYRQDKCVALCAAPYAPILTNLLFSCSVFLAQNIYCQARLSRCALPRVQP